jgi:hypothetical protein
MPEPPLSINLRYVGSEVEDGTMSLDEVVLALKGFAGAYGKIADHLIPSSSHELRVSAVEKGSIDLSILAWIGANADTVTGLKTVGSAAKYVFSILGNVIGAKKHIKSKPYSIAIEGSGNTVLVVNADGAKFEIPKEVVEILAVKLVDADLSKIASPLRPEITDAELTATDEQGSLEASIASEDRNSFVIGTSSETFQNVTITGKLMSNSKETQRGMFAKGDGSRVPYRYIGDSPLVFQSTYAHPGVVRISGIAYFDENLVLKHLDITSASKIQGELQFIPPEGPQSLQ